MSTFTGKILIIGCGGVAQCAIPLILKLINITPSRITILDFVDNRTKVAQAIKDGVNYEHDRITKENYAHLLSRYLQPGDILLDLAYNIDTQTLLKWCNKHGVMYLNTAIEEWDPYENAHAKEMTEFTLYDRHMRINAMVSTFEKGSPTAIVDHGANPGLVSHFTKQALIEIAQKIVAEKPRDSRRKKLEEALSNKDFAQLAYLTGVKTIHISERDTQIINKPKEVNEFVNTWSIDGFMEEGLAPAELGWGTHERTLPQNAHTHAHGPKNQICLSTKGMETHVRSWVPSGPIIGMVIRHGEAFSISDRLTVRDGKEVIYRPTVHYAYCPADAAVNSVHEFKMRHYAPQEKKRVIQDEIVDGRDELGCLLMGHDFTSWWIGSLLDIHEARRLVPGQNATTLQVAISVVAALDYMIRNPTIGYRLPDDIDHEEILSFSKPYLGPLISEPVNWTPLMQPEGSLEYTGRKIHPDDVWQFQTFLI